MEREIKVAPKNKNDFVVEVVSGLEEGDVIVLNPATLLDGKSNMKPGVPKSHLDGQRRQSPGDSGPSISNDPSRGTPGTPGTKGLKNKKD